MSAITISSSYHNHLLKHETIAFHLSYILIMVCDSASRPWIRYQSFGRIFWHQQRYSFFCTQPNNLFRPFEFSSQLFCWYAQQMETFSQFQPSRRPYRLQASTSTWMALPLPSLRQFKSMFFLPLTQASQAATIRTPRSSMKMSTVKARGTPLRCQT